MRGGLPASCSSQSVGGSDMKAALNITLLIVIVVPFGITLTEVLT